MKRNQDLIRQILLKIEAEDFETNGALTVNGHSDESISEHMQLLEQDRYLEGAKAYFMGVPLYMNAKLTSSGHSLLNTLR
jgi:hypothetical protein